MVSFLFIFVAYLLGSISSGVIVNRILGLPDPRHSGSNNSGATNVLRLSGKKAAAITLIGDVLKGVVPVVLAKILGMDDEVVALVGLCCFLGHLYPVFFGFQGGKGVATAAGVLFGLSPVLTLLIIILWLLVAVITRYSSLSALIAAAAAPFIVFVILDVPAYTLMTVTISILLFWRHRSNIRRLLNKQEEKISFGK